MADDRGVGGESSEDVLRRVQAEARAAAGGDPLAGLVERAKAAPEVAFEARAVDAAAGLDDVGYQRLRRDLRAAGVAVTQWDAAVRAARGRRRADEREQLAAAATDRRRAEEAAAEERRLDFERQRAGASPDLAAHFGEASSNGVVYRLRPGAVEMDEFDRGGRVVTRLAQFSSPIVADLLEYDAPQSKPRRSLGLSVMFDGQRDVAQAEKVSIPVGDLERMTWPERLFGSRGAVAPGRLAREHLRSALMLCSRAKTQRRYRFAGRVEDGTTPLHVHAGGAVSAAGRVEGVDVVLDDPASRFEVLLPASPEEHRAALLAALMLFDAEPAHVAIPLVAAAFRAPLEDSRLTLHISGRKGTGKSFLGGIAATFFGPSVVGPELFDRWPVSWADNSTAKGVSKVLSLCGNVLVPTDDLKTSGNSRVDEKNFKLYEDVTRAHFNRSSRRILTVDQEARSLPPTRCTILSTGEVFPRGHSTRDRVVSVELDARPRLNPQLIDAARGGLLARAMGPYIVRCLGEVSLTAVPVGRREAAAAAAWGLGADDRAAALGGALALGLDGFFAYLEANGCKTVDARRKKAEGALRAVAAATAAATEEEDPARLFCRLIGEALRSHAAHVARITPGGEPSEPSVSPPAWGWERRADGWVPLGPRIGRMEDGQRDVLIDPGPALSVARQIAQRDGAALALDREGLARQLRAAGLLARVDEERRTLTIRARVGAGLRAPHLAIKREALDLDDDGAAPAARDPEEVPPEEPEVLPPHLQF